jgi:6-phosphogluconolactonase
MREVITEDPHELARVGAEIIIEAAREAIRERGRFTIALAGGSSPRLIHQQLAASRDDHDWSRWEFFLGDERFVPESDPRSNLRSARENLLSKLPIAEARVHAMYAPGIDVHEAARRYERVLSESLGEPPVFDLVMLGVGRDAHTLSLHPGCEAIHEKARTVVGLPDPPMDPPVARVTFTPPVVACARRVLVILAGAEKADAARYVLQGPDDRMKFPAQIIRDARAEVTVLLTRDAAPTE